MDNGFSILGSLRLLVLKVIENLTGESIPLTGTLHMIGVYSITSTSLRRFGVNKV